MKKRFHFSIIALLFFAISSCSKSQLNSEETIPVTQFNDFKEDVIRKAKIEIGQKINLTDFQSLDWSNVIISGDNLSENDFLLTVYCLEDKSKILLYLVSGESKIYMWKNEVHSIEISMKDN